MSLADDDEAEESDWYADIAPAKELLKKRVAVSESDMLRCGLGNGWGNRRRTMRTDGVVAGSRLGSEATHSRDASKVTPPAPHLHIDSRSPASTMEVGGSAHPAAESFSPTDWEQVESSQALEYFAPITARQDPIPTPVSNGPTIIQFLFEAAGIDSAKYPPRSWDDLSQLLLDIQSSNFDTLKRNGLILYLLLDFHLLPPGQVDTSGAFQPRSQKADDVPQIHSWVVDSFIPDFWKDSIYKGFWNLDKGLHELAEPWLDANNSITYAYHIILTLSGAYSTDASKQILHYSKPNSLLVLSYNRIAKPDLSDAEDDVLRALLVAKATVEGIQGALEFARTRTDAQEAQELRSYLWAWVFNVKHPAQHNLVKSLTWLPLQPRELDSWTAFSLGDTAHSSHGKPCSLALDTLLVRLLNSGSVAQALKVNGTAEQRPAVYAQDEGQSVDVLKRKKRSEMLRLAKQSLPDMVRRELDRMSLSGRDVRDKGDETMDVEQSSNAVADDVDGPPSANTSVLPGYLLSHQAPGQRQHDVAPAVDASPARGPTVFSSSKPLPSQSPFASTSKRAPQFTPSVSRVADEGPYARLAAQIKQQRQQQTTATATKGAQEGDQEMSLDESMLLSSVLPKKRTLSAAQRGANGSGTDEQQAVESAAPSSSTEKPAPTSNFEMPQRRYTKRDDGGAATSKGKSEKEKKKKPTKASTGRVKSSKTTMALVSEPRSVATFPDDEPADEMAGPSSQRATRGGRSRSARAESESVPGAFPGQQEEEPVGAGTTDGDDSLETPDSHPLEMTEVPRRRGAAPASQPTRTRSTRGTSKPLPTASTPVRRSTRGHSRASSVASSVNEEDEEEEQQPVMTRRSSRSKASGGGAATRTRRSRVTRSMSVTSVSDAGTIDEEQYDEGGDGGEEVDADETPKGVIKTRSGRTVRKREVQMGWHCSDRRRGLTH